MSNENNKKDNKDDEVLMHFVIPYDWKRTLRGLFWINLGMIVGFTAIILFLESIGEVSLNDPQAQVCMVAGYVIMIAIYLLIRYTTVKYDKIKSKREIIVYPNKFVYTQENYKFEVPYLKTIKLTVKLSDKEVYMSGYYGVKINGFDSWQWRVDRSVIPKDFGYKKFVEEKAIPFAKLLIKRIKEVNPNLEVIWKDTRKKYR